MDPRYRHTRVRARRDASDDESDAGTSFNPGVSAAIDKSPVSDTISDEGSSESGLEKVCQFILCNVLRQIHGMID